MTKGLPTQSWYYGMILSVFGNEMVVTQLFSEREVLFERFWVVTTSWPVWRCTTSPRARTISSILVAVVHFVRLIWSFEPSIDEYCATQFVMNYMRFYTDELSSVRRSVPFELRFLRDVVESLRWPRCVLWVEKFRWELIEISRRVWEKLHVLIVDMSSVEIWELM